MDKETKNTGDYNTGEYNSGMYNSGMYNSGNRNSRDYNSGTCNGGMYNSGWYNSGCNNSGDKNSGWHNSGCNNSGWRNSGWHNGGGNNSGNFNSGNYNSGDFNKSSYNSGCFNTEEHKLTFFDKPTDMTIDDWKDSAAYYLLMDVEFRPTKWIIPDKMTDEEKKNNPEYETLGGYLKTCDTSNCFLDWWEKLTAEEKEIIKQIPNFDADKFLEITGIDVRKDEKQ